MNINLVNSRYFNVKMGDIDIDLEPCTLKTMKRFQNISSNTDDDLIKIAATLLNKNKAKYVVTEEIIETLTIDQLTQLLTEYFNWIAGEKSVNPN